MANVTLPVIAAKALLDVEADFTDLSPWEQRLDLSESPEAYHAFTHYRDLDTRDRTMNRAYTMHMEECRGSNTGESESDTLTKASGRWQLWKKDFKWDERVALKQAYEDRLAREQRARDIEAMNKRHANIAVVFQNKAVEKLQKIKLDEIPAKDVIAFFKVASDIERRARGEATEIVQNESNVTVSEVPQAHVIRQRLKDLGIIQEITTQIEEHGVIDIKPVEREQS